ncbi:hypothetical protein NKJ81_24515, partial [Mesorhizobium sp. M0018]|uniref:hypothetical protein n=1 Tax=Mesorhizobium sp. M0018 TaxID=2956844 RepID=UPI003335921E
MPRPFLARAAIRWALRRKPPVKQSMFDDDPPDPNYFFIYLRDAEGKRRYIVQDADYGGVGGLWFETNHADGEPRSLLNSELRKFNTSFRHYYRGHTLTYGGPFWFFFALSSFYPFRVYAWNKLLQRSFNRRPLTRADRMRVLQVFLQKTIRRPDFAVSLIPSGEGRLARGRHGSEAALLRSPLRAKLAAQHEP